MEITSSPGTAPMSTLSLASLCGQLLVVGYQGPEPSGALMAALERGECGGFIVFKRNLEHEGRARVEALATTLRAVAARAPADLPPLLAVDQEGGRVARLGAPVLPLPSMRALSAWAEGREELVERAEALSDKGTAAIPDYRRLLDEWKLAGRAGKRADDALWERFKAAGDILYAAKAEVDAKENEEFAGNLTEKLALLDEAEKLLTETDREKAKSGLLGIQRKWDAIGKVPRDSIRSVEDRLRKVETHVRKLDEDHWNKSDPEKVARSEGLASQLTSAIEKLERELDEAKAKGDARKIKDAEEALAARRVWLDALGS